MSANRVHQSQQDWWDQPQIGADATDQYGISVTIRRICVNLWLILSQCKGNAWRFESNSNVRTFDPRTPKRFERLTPIISEGKKEKTRPEQKNGWQKNKAARGSVSIFLPPIFLLSLAGSAIRGLSKLCGLPDLP